MKNMCAVLATHCSVHQDIDTVKPKNAPAAPTNPTSDLVSTFRKLVNKIYASPLMTENLHTAQIGGPAAELIIEEVDEDNIDDTQQATRQGIEDGSNTTAKSLGFHRSPRYKSNAVLHPSSTCASTSLAYSKLCMHDRHYDLIRCSLFCRLESTSSGHYR